MRLLLVTLNSPYIVDRARQYGSGAARPSVDRPVTGADLRAHVSIANDGRELLALCSARERWAQRAMYRVAWVVDLSGVLSATAQQRNLFSERFKRIEPHDRAYNQGSALIVPNAFVRGIVTAVFWLKPPSFPNQCFPDAKQAFAWAEMPGLRVPRLG